MDHKKEMKENQPEKTASKRQHPLYNSNLPDPEGIKINYRNAANLAAAVFAFSSLGEHQDFARANLDTSALRALSTDTQQEVLAQVENVQNPEAIEIITPNGELRIENYEEGSPFFVYIDNTIQRATRIFNDFTQQNNLDYPSYRIVLLADITQEGGQDVATPTPTPTPA